MSYDNNNRGQRSRVGQYQGGYTPNNNNANDYFATLNFKVEWITEGITKETVSFAEKAGKYMKENNLSSSQIRNVFGEIKRIQMKGYTEEKSSYYLLKAKVAYAVGRDDKKTQGLKLFQLIFNRCWECVSNDKTYKNFCDLMESIIAFHKSFGGK